MAIQQPHNPVWFSPLSTSQVTCTCGVFLPSTESDGLGELCALPNLQGCWYLNTDGNGSAHWLLCDPGD